MRRFQYSIAGLVLSSLLAGGVFFSWVGRDPWELERTTKCLQEHRSDAVFSPDERLAAFWSHDPNSGYCIPIVPPYPYTPEVTVYNIASGERICALSNPPIHITSIAFTPDETKLVSVDPTECRLWEVASGKQLNFYPLPDRTNLAVSPDGKRVAVFRRTSFCDDEFRFIELDSGTQQTPPCRNGPSIFPGRPMASA